MHTRFLKNTTTGHSRHNTVGQNVTSRLDISDDKGVENSNAKHSKRGRPDTVFLKPISGGAVAVTWSGVAEGVEERELPGGGKTT